MNNRTILYTFNKLTIRRLKKSDDRLLVSWLTNPEVLKYYEGRDRPQDLERVNESFFVEDEEYRCIIEYDGKPIGYIQFYQLDDESREKYGYTNLDEIIYGMDQFIGEPAYWNRGIGQQLIRSMIAYLTETMKADRIAMDPQSWNARALAVYEKCGFNKIKLLPEHERHEGEYRDCWLMEYTTS